MPTVLLDHGKTSTRPFLSAVTSLNVQRRNDALYLLATEFGRLLTPYDICKTQVLADVFQVVQTGKAIFGGRLYAMPFGPVAERILDDCKRWATDLFVATILARPVAAGKQPLQPAGWTGTHNHIAQFRASPDYDRGGVASWDSFSDDEEANVRDAYRRVIQMPWGESQAYFHDPVSAIGYAYDVATKPYAKPFEKRAEMNWFDVLDGAERIEGADVGHARAMLGLWA